MFQIIVYFLCASFLGTQCRAAINVSRLLDPVDLTWEFSTNTLYWTGIQPFTFTKRTADFSAGGYWYAANEFCAGEHGGTHLDAPFHFNPYGWKVHEIPIERLLPNAAFIDMSDIERVESHRTKLEIRHLENWNTMYGPFEPNTVLVVKFNWSQFWPNRTQFFGIDSEGYLHFPGLTASAAKWISKDTNIVGVGVDTPSVDYGNQSDFEVHRILCRHQIYTMENLKLLDPLPPKGIRLIVMPMKIEDGSAAPLRVFAVPKPKRGVL